MSNPLSPLLLVGQTTFCNPATKPNFLIIFADDHGGGDTSSYRACGLRTPNMDRLFNQGQRLNNFISGCVWPPARAMLLNAWHPFRVGTGPLSWWHHRFFDRNELDEIRKGEGKARNVADAHPDLVKSPTAKMNVWSKSTGTMLTSQTIPKKLDAKPTPEGEVLEVTVTVTSKAKPNDQLVVPIVKMSVPIIATDGIEYDFAIAEKSLPQGYDHSPLKGNDNSTITTLFKRGEGIDQFGREQASGPAIQSDAGTWEHRIISVRVRTVAASELGK